MNKLAFDGDSQRKTDDNGFLQIEKTNISKAIVNPYYGKEIPKFNDLGLEPDAVYYLLRAPDELEKSAPTFNNLPVLSEHIPVFSDNPPKDKVIGSTGSNAKFDGTYLTNSMSVWEGNAIRLIEADAKKELSSAYLYDADMTSGKYDGVKYDGIMRNIRGNHVAIVESGRAGSDVVVADNNPFFNPEVSMKLTKKGLARLQLFRAATMTPKLAMDAALLNTAKIDKEKFKAALLAMDISPEQLDNILDAVIGVEESPEPVDLTTPNTPLEGGVGDSEDETPGGKLGAFLASKGLGVDDIETAKSFLEQPAVDELPQKDDESDKEVIDKPAMDAALKQQESRMMTRFKNLEQAKSDVRGVVGDVLGMDSAESVYKFALKQAGVKHDGVNELAGLKAIFKASQGSSMAQDSARVNVTNSRKELGDSIPAIKRFL